jgi:hypothetical protein
MPRPPLTVVVVTALALGFGTVGCGAEKKDAQATPTSLQDCRDQWHDVAESIVGLDEDNDPSALASRWTSVLATVDYYENTDTAKGCQENVEAQVKAITLLRQFSDKLRAYDMAYQVARAAASIDLYLHDPLPAPARNENGKLIQPPTQAAVTAAFQTLTEQAPSANTELQPGWAQLASVELTDAEAVTAALKDLDFLAQDSPSWRQCEQALQIVTAAISAQEGTVASPTASATATPTS